MTAPITRRNFIQQVGAGTTALLTAGCKTTPNQQVEAAPVIDTHTHFYDPSRPEGVPWPPKDDPVLYRTVLPATYQALATPVPVTGTVVVEASPWVEDNQWILDLAAQHPFIVGLVGNLPVGTPAFSGHLERFVANPRFRGLRLRGINLDQALAQPAFLADLKRVADLDLALDLVGDPGLLAPALRLARSFPNLRIVIDHLAGVRIDGEPPPADWLAGMSALAECAKVHCKLSGLVEGTGRRGGNAPHDVAFYRPVLDAIWERFGPDRLIYGSNWPVCEHFASLNTVHRLAHSYVADHGNPALTRVFSGNAARVYGS